MASSSVSKQQPNDSSPVLSASDILTPTELSARLKVKPGWIYEQMRPNRSTNPLPALRAGRLLRFSWTAVCEWLHGRGAANPRKRKAARA
jgi:hypothetical protein